MSEKKKPVFRKKKKVEETDIEYARRKIKESLNIPDERDEPLQLEFDFGFGDFFDSSDPDELA